MIRQRSHLPMAVLALAAAFAAWAVLSASRALAQAFNLGVYFLATLVVFIDGLDFLLRVYFRQVQGLEVGGSRLTPPTSIPLDVGRFTPYQKRLHLRPYALLVSVHNAAARIDDFREALTLYRERLWAIDDGSTDDTAVRLRQAGFRCLAGGGNRQKPGALRELLRYLPPEVQTVLVLDPDVRLGDPETLEEVLFDFQRSGMAALCPRLAVAPDGWLARLQGLEYWLAFSLGRKSLADHSITSGIAVYRRDALEKVLAEHSLSVYAEDLENALILLAAGEEVYYDGRLTIETEAKRTWRAWFSQRVGWSYGLIKVFGERFGAVRRAARGQAVVVYQYLIYMGLFSLALHPLKLVGLGVVTASLATGLDGLFGLGLVGGGPGTDPVYFLAAYAKGTALSLAALLLAVGRGDRLRLLPAVPFYFFYSLLQVVATTVGYANWFSLKLWRRRLYRDHYQDEGSLVRQELAAARRLEP